MKRTLLTLFAAFIATAMVMPAQAAPTCDEIEDTATVTNGGATYTIDFCGSEYDAEEDETTFLYKVTSSGSPGLSHWTLQLCAEALEAFLRATPDNPEIDDDVETGGPFPQSGFNGIKFDTPNFTMGEFSFTLDGFFGEGNTGVYGKGGPTGDYAADGITGPSCEAPVCTIETLPSWDGQIDFLPQMAFIDLNAPNGFKSIEIMGGSQNIVLLEVVGEATTGSNPLPSIFAPGFGLLEYNGGDPAPTAVTVKFGPQEQAGSTFMFRVTDQDDCTLQVDPQIDMTVPETIELRGNYPNPFNPSTSIEFSLPEAADVRLDVYDAMGRLVRSLVNANLEAGVHNVSWNGTDAAGRQVASGAYFYRVQTGSVVHTKQMMLLK